MPQNNTWIKITRSRTAVIFVHGILSSSVSCWLNKKTNTYWPSLVGDDPRFEDAAVFVNDYTADIGAGLYDIRDAAEEAITRLRSSSVMSKSRLLFVCHSQGGIVVRQMLSSFFEDFATKKVGVVLCGSPSWGSWWATVLTPLTLLIRFRQGAALRWGGSNLVNLDKEFLNLVHRKRIPDLCGMSLVETRGPLHLPRIVPEASATRYFPIWHRIPKSTHSAVVKPNGYDHLSHVYLRDFAQNSGFLSRADFERVAKDLLIRMQAVIEAFDAVKPGGPQQKAEAISQLRERAQQAIDLTDREDRLDQVPLIRIVNASLDGRGEWAFDNLSRSNFSTIRDNLAELLKAI
ncbi:MAG: esterase/lipase family protein [Gemmatimonadaceae bacterium]